MLVVFFMVVVIYNCYHWSLNWRCGGFLALVITKPIL